MREDCRMKEYLKILKGSNESKFARTAKIVASLLFLPVANLRRYVAKTYLK